MSHKFKKDDRVWWTDPAENECSGAGVITHVQGEDEPDYEPEDDNVISITKDDRGVVEALPKELTKLKLVGVVQGALTRMEFNGIVEVPEDMPDNEIINRLYTHTCGSEYQQDSEYWERGEGYLIEPEQIHTEPKPTYEIGPRGDIKYRGPIVPPKEHPLLSQVMDETIKAGANELDCAEDNSFQVNNLMRAQRAFAAVEAFWGSDGNDDVSAVIGDLVCDMQHLARMLGIDWEELVAKSGRCNAEEVLGGV